MKQKLTSIALAAAVAATMFSWGPPQAAVYADGVIPDAKSLLPADEVAALKADRYDKQFRTMENSLDAAEKAYEKASGEFSVALEDYERKLRVSEQADKAWETAKAGRAEAAEALSDTIREEGAAEKSQRATTAELIARTNEQRDAWDEATAAEEAMKTATLQWSWDKTAAEKRLQQAREDCEITGYDFINAKVNAMGARYFTIDEIIESEKESDYEVTAWDGKTKLTMKQIVSDKDFLEIVQSACSYENLKQGIDFISRTNELRANARHEVPELEVNYQLIANAVVSAAVSAYARGHNLVEGSNHEYWTIDTPLSYIPRNENLAYSTTPAYGKYDYDPFDSWYYEERIIQIGMEQGGVTQEIVDQVIEEAAADGRTFDPYVYRTKEEFLKQMNSEQTTGHYLAIIDPETTAMGAAYTDVPADYQKKYMVDPYGWVYSAMSSLEFNNTETNTITVQEYEEDMDSFFEAYQTEFLEAKEEAEALESEPDYVVAARTKLEVAHEELARIHEDVMDTQEQQDSSEKALDLTESDLFIRQASYFAAVTEEGRAEEEANSARREMLAARRAMENRAVDVQAASAGLREQMKALACLQQDSVQ